MSRNDAAKLFVGSMPMGTTDIQVRELFSPFGTVEEVFMMTGNGRSGQQCCFVRYQTTAEAQAAVDALHGKHDMNSCGMCVEVRFADSKRKREKQRITCTNNMQQKAPNGTIIRDFMK
jgi:RNA recognition motif-containing protein